MMMHLSHTMTAKTACKRSTSAVQCRYAQRFMLTSGITQIKYLCIEVTTSKEGISSIRLQSQLQIPMWWNHSKNKIMSEERVIAH